MTADLEMIGGELRTFAEPQPPAGGPGLAALLHAVAEPGTTVLLAGPHAADLIEALDGAKVTALLRGHPDAESLAAAHSGVRVVCGSIDRLPAETFDLVVALAGLHRLISAEGAQLTWGETLGRLAGAVAPGGRLLVAAENPLGVHRLVAFAPAEDPNSDESWSPAASADASRPASAAQLRDALTAAGLAPVVAYAAYAVPHAPSLLVTGGALPLLPPGQLAASCADLSGPVLSDPRGIAADALRAGLAAGLAPSWLTLATKPDPSAGTPKAMPDGFLAEPGVTGDLRVALHVVVTGDGTLNRVPAATAALVHGPVTRDPARLVGAIPPGRLLAEVLLGHILRRDVPAVRGTLRAYAQWLEQAGDGAVFATVDRVVVDGDEHTPLDASWRWTEPVRTELVLAVALRDFAVTLITEGHPHGWPAGLDADGLTALLAGLAGRELGRTVLTEATALAATIASAVRGLTPQETADLREALATVGTGSVPLTVESHRELLLAAQAGRAEVIRLRAVLKRTEDWLADCERKLKDAQRGLTKLKESKAYDIGRKIVRPVRKLRRMLRGGK
ncbi:hypothetical protein F4553_003990 [Allocatelliglobosispora scoriae]|uniref:Class I SAM-dependent methyltransferase n=1 Tax=Allocatelliglobosispora scoriae TaxID=643052 RepID=A0A841BV36_9ACTN|nr:class I SAM-dependent methyltransferase [Allocatelliglobosispora scoriae]MBB5870611.1 hypothetical protein [Allocatelliglobosispora scoriae]